MNQTKKNGKWKRKMEPYAFLVPLVLILFLFLVIPLVKAAIMSFQYYYVTKPSPNGHYFVGLENYGKVLKDEYFFNSVKVTLIYIVVTVAGRYIIGFITALLLNTKFLGRGLARALIIIPWAVPEVVACLVWILMYDKDYGIINFLLNNAGILSHNIAYLQDVSVALPAAMVVNIWKGFPYVAIMLLAGMQSVSTDLYEAADIDGATTFQKNPLHYSSGNPFGIDNSIFTADYLDDQGLCNRLCTDQGRSVKSNRTSDYLYTADRI